ncbi:MAG: pyridoxal-dependent decarboxylase [Phycisphaerae bacterium]|nr:MAG: pyridoxal-dependent decarboxylase [Phycisphaerae bacterium]
MDQPSLDRDELRAGIDHAAAWVEAYWEKVASLPVRSRVKPGDVLRALPEHPPTTGEADWGAIDRDLDAIVLPGLTHWQHPMFFAYFPSNISPAAIMGDVLSAGMGVQGMLWATSPACTEVEMRVLDWMGEALGLPQAFLFRGGGGGVIDGTASEAAVGALLAAKGRVLRALPREARREAATRLVVYASTQAHSSIQKAAMVAGIALDADDHDRVRLIETDAVYAMRPDQLAEAMRADLAAGLRPCFVCASVGTTGSTAIDPVGEIARVMREVPNDGASPTHQPPPSGREGSVWLHVDAAHAGAACVCPEFRRLIAGVEHADSFTFNPHKWLLTNFDCNCLWTQSPRELTDAMSITPEYLRNAATDAKAVVDYRDWHIPLGRRFRSLKLWLVMRRYGVEGLRTHVREGVRLAEVFEGLVRGDARFEVVTPRTVNLVCFRLVPRTGELPETTDARNKTLMESLNDSGAMYLSHTVLPGVGGTPARYVLRMAIGAVQTREAHVREAWRLIASRAG